MVPQTSRDSEDVDLTSVRSDHSDGNSNQSLTSTRLNEFNYLHWSRAITLAIGGRSRLPFIKENKIESVKSPEYENNLCKDQQVRSWILNSMEPGIAEIFNYYEYAFEL